MTDVDDPLLERAEATGEDWVALAERETELFRTDMEALRVIAPDADVGAVEAIPLVVTMVQRLQRAGAAYDVDGDLYFSVAADPSFGEVETYMTGFGWLAKLVTVAILAGFSSVILVMLLGQSRVFYSMSRDGLMPKIFSDLHPTFRRRISQI